MKSMAWCLMGVLAGLVSTHADSQDMISDIQCLTEDVMDGIPEIVKPLIKLVEDFEICIGYSLATCGGKEDMHLNVNVTVGGELVEEQDLADYKNTPFCVSNNDLPMWAKNAGSLGILSGALGKCKICFSFDVTELKPAFATFCPKIYEDCSDANLGLPASIFKLDNIPLQDVPCQSIGSECSSYNSCGSCSATPGCGWCVEDNACHYGLGDLVYCGACSQGSEFLYEEGSCKGGKALHGDGDGPGGRGDKGGNGGDVGLIVGLVILGLLVVAVLVFLWRRSQKKNYRSNPPAAGFSQPMQLEEDDMGVDLSEVPGGTVGIHTATV